MCARVVCAANENKRVFFELRYLLVKSAKPLRKEEVRRSPDPEKTQPG